MDKKLVILTGPTAAGKTELSINLAKKINGEIISADSMQVYRGMDIGSAKITEEEKCGVPHHLIDILEPEDEFNVFLFKKLATEAIDDIISRGKIPIIVGGTGFYIQSVLYDVDFTTEEDNGEIRARLEKEAEADSDALYERLKDVDPDSAEAIHKNNIKRVIRALEYHELTGGLMSEHNETERARKKAYLNRYFVLTMDRAKLYERIDKRVDIMLDKGLVDEVKSLKERGLTKDNISMQGLGYKEILGYLDGEYDLDRAVYLIKRDTRHFAKRQLTWFRREKDVTMIDKDHFKNDDEILDEMLKDLKKTGII